MILNSALVVELQFFLMEIAKRYAPPACDTVSNARDVLTAAAALDYALLVASEHRGLPVDRSDPSARSAHEALTGALSCALRAAHELLAAPSATFTDFEARFLRPGFLQTLHALRADGAVDEARIAFAALTFESDLTERRAREERA